MADQTPPQIHFDYTERESVESHVPGEQKLRESVEASELAISSSSDQGDKVEGPDDYILAPVMSMVKTEAVYTKGDVKLQKVAVTENVSAEHPEIHSEVIRENHPMRTIGASETEVKKSRIPRMKFREAVNKLRKERREDIAAEKEGQPRPRRSSIPKLIKTTAGKEKQAEEEHKTDKNEKHTEEIHKTKNEKETHIEDLQKSTDKNEKFVEDEHKTDEKEKHTENESKTSEEKEFDKIYDEIVDTPVEIDVSLLTSKLEDPEVVEDNFDELVHAYEAEPVDDVNDLETQPIRHNNNTDNEQVPKSILKKPSNFGDSGSKINEPHIPKQQKIQSERVNVVEYNYENNPSNDAMPATDVVEESVIIEENTVDRTVKREPISDDLENPKPEPHLFETEDVKMTPEIISVDFVDNKIAENNYPKPIYQEINEKFVTNAETEINDTINQSELISLAIDEALNYNQIQEIAHTINTINNDATFSEVAELVPDIIKEKAVISVADECAAEKLNNHVTAMENVATFEHQASSKEENSPSNESIGTIPSSVIEQDVPEVNNYKNQPPITLMLEKQTAIYEPSEQNTSTTNLVDNNIIELTTTDIEEPTLVSNKTEKEISEIANDQAITLVVTEINTPTLINNFNSDQGNNDVETEEDTLKGRVRFCEKVDVIPSNEFSALEPIRPSLLIKEDQTTESIESKEGIETTEETAVIVDKHEEAAAKIRVEDESAQEITTPSPVVIKHETSEIISQQDTRVSLAIDDEPPIYKETEEALIVDDSTVENKRSEFILQELKLEPTTLEEITLATVIVQSDEIPTPKNIEGAVILFEEVLPVSFAEESKTEIPVNEELEEKLPKDATASSEITDLEVTPIFIATEEAETKAVEEIVAKDIVDISVQEKIPISKVHEYDAVVMEEQNPELVTVEKNKLPIFDEPQKETDKEKTNTIEAEAVNEEVVTLDELPVSAKDSDATLNEEPEEETFIFIAKPKENLIFEAVPVSIIRVTESEVPVCEKFKDEGTGVKEENNNTTALEEVAPASDIVEKVKDFPVDPKIIEEIPTDIVKQTDATFLQEVGHVIISTTPKPDVQFWELNQESEGPEKEERLEHEPSFKERFEEETARVTVDETSALEEVAPVSIVIVNETEVPIHEVIEDISSVVTEETGTSVLEVAPVLLVSNEEPDISNQEDEIEAPKSTEKDTEITVSEEVEPVSIVTVLDTADQSDDTLRQESEKFAEEDSNVKSLEKQNTVSCIKEEREDETAKVQGEDRDTTKEEDAPVSIVIVNETKQPDNEIIKEELLKVITEDTETGVLDQISKKETGDAFEDEVEVPRTTAEDTELKVLEAEPISIVTESETEVQVCDKLIVDSEIDDTNDENKLNQTVPIEPASISIITVNETEGIVCKEVEDEAQRSQEDIDTTVFDDVALVSNDLEKEQNDIGVELEPEAESPNSTSEIVVLEDTESISILTQNETVMVVNEEHEEEASRANIEVCDRTSQVPIYAEVKKLNPTPVVDNTESTTTGVAPLSTAVNKETGEEIKTENSIAETTIIDHKEVVPVPIVTVIPGILTVVQVETETPLPKATETETTVTEIAPILIATPVYEEPIYEEIDFTLKVEAKNTENNVLEDVASDSILVIPEAEVPAHDELAEETKTLAEDTEITLIENSTPISFVSENESDVSIKIEFTEEDNKIHVMEKTETPIPKTENAEIAEIAIPVSEELKEEIPEWKEKDITTVLEDTEPIFNVSNEETDILDFKGHQNEALSDEAAESKPSVLEEAPTMAVNNIEVPYSEELVEQTISNSQDGKTIVFEEAPVAIINIREGIPIYKDTTSQGIENVERIPIKPVKVVPIEEYNMKIQEYLKSLIPRHIENEPPNKYFTDKTEDIENEAPLYVDDIIAPTNIFDETDVKITDRENDIPTQSYVKEAKQDKSLDEEIEILPNKSQIAKDNKAELEEDNIVLKGKVKRIINRLTSRDDHKTEKQSDETLKSYSVLSKIAMFEQKVESGPILRKNKDFKCSSNYKANNNTDNSKPKVINGILKSDAQKNAPYESPYKAHNSVNKVEYVKKLPTKEFIPYENKNQTQLKSVDIFKEENGLINDVNNVNDEYKNYDEYKAEIDDVKAVKSLRKQSSTIENRVKLLPTDDVNLNKSKSMADLDLGEELKGKVHRMIYRINSGEYLNIDKELKSPMRRERPRSKSVSEKIALFESKRATSSPGPKTIKTRATETNLDAPLTDQEIQAKIAELARSAEYQKINATYLTLADGVQMPMVTVGTALIDKRLTSHVVAAAIHLGYRAIDSAYIYGNEKEIGEGIKKKIDDGTVTRKDLFVVSKLWSTFHTPQLAEQACRSSLAAMGLQYFDQYLIHNPMSFKEGGDPLPKIAGVLQYSENDYLDAWYGLEQLVAKGLARSVGVSNFNSSQIQRVIEKARVKPVVNQVECHPYLSQRRLDTFCSERNVTLSCYGVLGSKGTPASLKAFNTPVIDDPVVTRMADAHNVTAAQLLIGYHLQQGRPVVVKASSAKRLHENLLAQNVTLADSEIEGLHELNKNKRTFVFAGMGDTHKNYPFRGPY